jgi:hypothetical protein
MEAQAIYATSDLYKAGLDEDGYAYSAEFFYVVVELKDGRTFKSDDFFLGCKTGVDDEGEPVFEDVRDEAKKAAEALADSYRQGRIDLDSFHEFKSDYSDWY